MDEQEIFGAIPWEAVAHHEAAHAVVLSAFQLRPSSVTVEVDEHDHSAGRVTQPPTNTDPTYFSNQGPDAKRQWVDAQILSSLAGPLATERLGGLTEEQQRASAEADEGDAVRYARYLFPTDSEAHAYVERVRDQAARMFDPPAAWPAIEAVAAALLERHTLTGDEVVDVINDVAGGAGT